MLLPQKAGRSGNGGSRAHRTGRWLGVVLAVLALVGACPVQAVVPWTDGEQLIYTVRERRGGPVTGYAVSTIDTAGDAAEPLWRIRFQTLRDTVSTSIIDVHRDTFLPTRSYYRSEAGGEVEAGFSGNEIHVEQKSQALGGRLGLSASTYSSYQSLYLVRLFPLDKGHQEESWLVDPRRPMSRQSTLMRLEDFETLRTIDGDRRVCRVRSRSGEGRYTFWVGADERRLPYRIVEEGGDIMDLVEVRRPQAGPFLFTSPAFGYSFELPPAWTAFPKQADFPLPGRETIAFLLPDAAADLSLVRHPRFAPLEQVVAGSKDWLIRNKPEMRLDAVVEVSFPAGGLRGSWFTGTYMDDGTPRGLIHAIVETPDSLLIFTGTVPESSLPALRSSFAQMIATVRLQADQPAS